MRVLTVRQPWAWAILDVHPLMGSWTRENEWRVTCCTSPWADAGYSEDHGRERRDIVHFELANPRPLAEPIPFRGTLGLRTLDADAIARVEEAIV